MVDTVVSHRVQTVFPPEHTPSPTPTPHRRWINITCLPYLQTKSSRSCDQSHSGRHVHSLRALINSSIPTTTRQNQTNPTQKNQSGSLTRKGSWPSLFVNRLTQVLLTLCPSPTFHLQVCRLPAPRSGFSLLFFYSFKGRAWLKASPAIDTIVFRVLSFSLAGTRHGYGVWLRLVDYTPTLRVSCLNQPTFFLLFGVWLKEITSII